MTPTPGAGHEPMNQQLPPLVVLSLNKRLVAMNAHTGQRVWEYETGALPEGRLFVDQNIVVYAIGRGLLCLDYMTGALRWKVPLPGSVGMGDERMIAFAGCVVVLGVAEAVCFNAQTGAQLWHDTFKGYGMGSGAIAAPGVAAQVDKR